MLQTEPPEGVWYCEERSDERETTEERRDDGGTT
jgi:hypothetical protein